MGYKFENIGNVDFAEIAIEKGKTNIKYGFNGIGKTTITKALEYALGDDDQKQILQKQLLSLRTGKEIVVDKGIKSDFKGIFVYDNRFFNGLFRQTDLLNDTYEMLFKSDEYEELIKNITGEINEIKSLLQEGNYHDFYNLVHDFEGRSVIAYKRDGTPAKTTSVLYKYASEGVQITGGLPSDLTDYKPYMDSNIRSEWSKWLDKGKRFLAISPCRCPFCGNEHSDIKAKTDCLFAFKKTSDYSSYDKEQQLVIKASDYVADELVNGVLKINDINGKLDLESAQPLIDVVEMFKEQWTNIDYLLSFDAKSISKYQSSERLNELKNDLGAHKLSDSFVMKDQSGNNVANKINKLIEKVIEEIDNKRGEIGRLKTKIVNLVEKNERLINEFLDIAGLPYKVSINQESDTSFKTLFSHKDGTVWIDNQIDYLSYGEANALALLLFAIEAKSKEDYLIVLDDPVSSFDSNKRYAVYSYLFNSKKDKRLLFRKTVLALTHDFESVVIFAKCHPFASQEEILFAHLDNHDHVITEKIFGRGDIVSTVNLYKDFAQDLSNSKIARVTAARNFFEITKGTGCQEYNLLSNIQKAYKDGGRISEYSQDDIYRMSDGIAKVIGNDFNYQSFVSEISNKAIMKNRYYDCKSSKYDKLCIARALLFKDENRNVEENVICDFLSNIYHVETDFIHSISGINIFDVPDYIIALCDERMSVL
ncbi:MAG: AAA family ATPase [Bacilli bacterium]|nr:AAA family ATPase [Bacilli bacterium]